MSFNAHAFGCSCSLLALYILSCGIYRPEDSGSTGIAPIITISDNACIIWFEDSLLLLPVLPASIDTSGPDPVGIIGCPDYVGTVLPESCWALILYSAFTPDTFFCIGDTCRRHSAIWLIGEYWPDNGMQ